MAEMKYDQILIHLEYIREKQDETNTHLRELNGRTTKTETRLSVLEDRAEQAVIATQQAKASAVKWGAGIGAAISALIAGLSQISGVK